MEIKNTDKKYNHVGHLVFSCQYHVIFCPKYRRPVLVNGVDKRFKEIVTEKQTEYGYKVLDMEVMPDHVHLILDVNPKVGIFSIVSKIKGCTSRILRLEFPALKRRIPTLWTHSMFISSVGAVTLEVVKKYIEEQKKV
jgi:putative transposase